MGAKLPLQLGLDRSLPSALGKSFSESHQGFDHFRAPNPHLAAMERSDFCQQLRSLAGELEENLTPIQRALPPADEAGALQSIDQAHRTMMSYLEAFAEIADREAILGRTRFQREEHLVLFGRKLRLGF